MTFRTADLIHCRLQQSIGRVIPAAKPMAATLVAVFLLLGASSAALADGPGEADDCAGLQAVTLTASTETTVRTDHPPSAAGCGLPLELGQLPPIDDQRSPDAEPCVVTATPSPMGVTGIRVLIRPVGDCDGAEIRLTTSIGPQGNPGGGTQASSGYAAAYAKIVGKDPIDLDMFYNKSKVAWGYTATTVDSASHYPSDWVWSSFVWSVTSRASSLTKQGDTSYQGYNHVKFKAVQFTEADTKATLVAKPGGAFSCNFSIKWKLAPIGFGHSTECDTE